MTLRGKLLAAQMPLIIALAVVGMASVFALARLGAKAGEIVSENHRSVLAAQRMGATIERLDDIALSVALCAPKSDVGGAVAKLTEDFGNELKAAEGKITEPGEGEILSRLRAGWSKAYPLLLAAVEKHYPPNASRILPDGELTAGLGQVRAEISNLLFLHQDAMVRKSEAAAKFSETLRKALLILCAFSVAGALALAFRMTQSFLRPFRILQQAVRDVGEGDLAARAKIEGEDEVAALAHDFDAMAERLAKYRKSSLGELLRAQQAAQASMDSLPEPVLVFGTGGELITSNLASDSLAGGEFDPKKAGEPFAGRIEALKKHVLGGMGGWIPKGLDETIKIPAREGDRYFLPYASPLRGEDGSTIGVTVVLQDVTRFKRFDELKDDMVSTVAHEFKTPLASLRMAIHVCLERLVGPLTEKQADMLTAAREECERLQALVDDLVDLSRLQAGITPTSPEPVAAASLIIDAFKRHEAKAKESGIELKAAEVTPVAVLADPERIASVFDILVSNALSNTPRGGAISLGAAEFGDRVRFEVKDSGPGIPLEHLSRIFDRLNPPGAENGFGASGLSLVREIVLAHGGEAGAESEAGLGSVFWFTLNRAKSGENA